MIAIATKQHWWDLVGLNETRCDWMGFGGIKMELCGIGGNLMGLDSVVLDGIRWDWMGFCVVGFG